MARAFVATYERPAAFEDSPPVTTRLFVYADDHASAMRLADQVFEQVYLAAPGRLGFVQLLVRPAVLT